MGILLSLILVAILFAGRLYGKSFKSENTTDGLSGVLANKWYVDELYDTIVIKPLDRLAAFLGSVVDNKIVDGLVNGVGKAVQFSGRQMRLLQSGQVGSYILIMMISIILFFIFQLFWK
jgi:NADH-quinone oxidoreductase subunit L